MPLTEGGLEHRDGRLCGYYPECVAQDMDEGASAEVASRYGVPDYAELPSLPIADAAEDSFDAPG